MPQACVYLPDGRRIDAFRSGFDRLGYFVTDKPRGKPGDVLAIWNRRPVDEDYARRYETAGCPVIVTENGWIGSDESGHRFYALCRGHHNGAGTWSVGEEDRWSRLGITLKPWRVDGEHILILPQRGIGEAGVAMPKGWTEYTADMLRRITGRPIRIRKHPGKEQSSLDPDLDGCWAVVTWGSGAGIKSIVAGIPVFHDLERWIGGPAAKFGVSDIENPFVGDRLPMLRRLAWAQWSLQEISSGEPFARLIEK